MASICGSPVCAGGKPKLKFTYTGDYVVRKDGVVELLTSGTIVFLEPKIIDVFMVGGGGSGSTISTTTNWGGGGGSGGYTRTVRKISMPANTEIPVTVGAGGETPNRTGGASGFNNIVVNGGGHSPGNSGGPGGSGGGGGVVSNSDYGAGGSDGSAGENGSPASTHNGGAGQGFSTREFGEATGKLYAGGGGGGRYMSSQTPIISSGGAGGGGSGAWQGTTSAEQSQAPAAGVANTGGGGGGGAGSGNWRHPGASGGSGIVCFREAQELPELSGTWVLNERLYRPNEVFTETINFEVSLDGTSFSPCTKATFELRALFLNIPNAGNLNVYSFNDSSWTRRYKYWKFTAGATATDKFRAWLASNATKQA